MATAHIDPEPAAPRFLIRNVASISDPKDAGRVALERVQALSSKARGFPRRGVRRDGKPIPPGVPCVTEHWAGIEADEAGTRLRHPALPDVDVELAADADPLTTEERAELVAVVRDEAVELPADWHEAIAVEL